MKRKLFVKVVFLLFHRAGANENEDLIFMEIARKLSEVIKTITKIFMEIRGIFVVIRVQKRHRDDGFYKNTNCRKLPTNDHK